MNGYHRWLTQPGVNPLYALELLRLAAAGDYEAARSVRLPPTCIRAEYQQQLQRLYPQVRDWRDLQLQQSPFNFGHRFLLAQALVAGHRPSAEELRQFHHIGRTDSCCCWHIHCLWRTGCPTFNISLELQQLLLLTDVHLDWDDLQLPFDSVLLQPAPGLYLHSPTTGAHELDTIILNRAIDTDGQQLLAVLLMAAENANSSARGDDAVFYLNLRQAQTVDQALARTLSGPDDDGQPLPTVSGDLQSMERVIRLIIAILTYINSRPADVQRLLPPGWERLKQRAQRSKAAKAKMERAKTEFGRQWQVGQAITISKELRTVAEAVGRGQPLDHAVYTRGHMRAQVCGPQRADRKIIWIAPYWRGLQAGPPRPSEYEVKP